MNVTVWNRVTTDFYGRSVYGSYVTENDTIITVKARRDEKAMQLRSLNPDQLAEPAIARVGGGREGIDKRKAVPSLRSRGDDNLKCV